MLLCGKYGALLVTATGRIGAERGAKVCFSLVTGTAIFRVGESFKAVVQLPRKTVLSFLLQAHRALIAAGHPTRLHCVIAPV